MGRELQKKKRRSSLPKVKQKPKPKKLLINNPIIAKHWNKKETLSQNYRRLGLTAKLQHATGGTEKFKEDMQPAQTENVSSIGGNSQSKITAIVPQEVGIERDPTTGAIVRILQPEGTDERALTQNAHSSEPHSKNATFSRPKFSEWEPDSSSDGETFTNGSTVTAGTVVSELARQATARKGVSKRKQSAREIEWLSRLVAKHGDDCARMARDMKLNPMQQSEGDIRRRIMRWKEGH